MSKKDKNKKNFKLFTKIILICLGFSLVFGTPSEESLYKNILKAQNYSSSGDFFKASKIFQDLYKSTNEPFFLRELAVLNKNEGLLEEAIKYALSYQEKSKDLDDIEINEIIIQDYIRKKKLKEATLLVLKLKSIKNTPKIQLLLANLYDLQQEKLKALQAFKDYLDFELYDENMLNVVADYFKYAYMDLKKGTKEDAEVAKGYILDSINKYFKSHECQDNVKACQIFLSLYEDTSSFKKAINVFSKKLEVNKNTLNANVLLSLYFLAKEDKKAEALVKDNLKIWLDEGEESLLFLLEIYAQKDNFKNAHNLAIKIYKSTNIPIFLGLSAVYSYDYLEHSKKNLTKIIQTIEKSIQLRGQKKGFKLSPTDAFLYNFVGYMLIDYDIDAKKGLDYAAIAVSISPSNYEYLDSLAWGFYKTGDCKKAKETFTLISQDNINAQEELKTHLEQINKCIKNAASN